MTAIGDLFIEIDQFFHQIPMILIFGVLRFTDCMMLNVSTSFELIDKIRNSISQQKFKKLLVIF